MKHLLFISIFLGFFLNTFAQTEPSSVNYKQIDSEQTTYTVKGWGNDYNSSTDFNLYFGFESEGVVSQDDVIDFFEIGSDRYEAVVRNNGESFDNIIVNRVANTQESDLDKQTLFFERGSRDGTKLFYTPSYTRIEETVNNRIHNRGADNVFANSGGQTINNVERIDMIIDGGVFSPDATKGGFLINERGGNDPAKLAAITALDSNGEVASLGNIISISSNDWGSTGKSIATTVFQRNYSDTDMRPAQDLGSQNISAIYVTFDDFGIADDEIIYGFSIFPNDIDASMDLVGLTDVPLNTNGNSDGGLDLMGGGGFYSNELLVVDLEACIAPPAITPENGDIFEMSFIARNNGPQNEITDVSLTVNIPNGYDFKAITSTTEGTATYNSGSKEITWLFTGGIALQDCDTLVVELEALSVGDREFTNIISGGTTDISPGNNTRNLKLETSDGTLPVELVYFKGSERSNYNLLEWSTASEINNDYFLLERSNDGVNFNALGKVNAAGNSFSRKDYSYQDYDIENQRYYYRLTQFDYDGKSETFNIVSINPRLNTADVNIYPNPANKYVYIENHNIGDIVSVINSNGSVLKKEKITTYDYQINISDLDKGLYLIKINSGNNTHFTKLIKN